MKESWANRLPRAWHAAHPNHRNIVRGFVSIGAFAVAAKLAAAAKEIAVAARYGVSGIVDAYLLAFTISTWLSTIVVSVGTVVLVPRLVALDTASADRGRFLAELNGTTLVYGIALAALTAVAGPWIVPWISGELGPATQAATRAMVTQLAPLALLTLAAGAMTIRLQASQRHGYALAEAAPPLGIVLFVSLALPGVDPAPLLWGTLAGCATQVAWSAHMSQRVDGTVGGLSLRHRSPPWRGACGALVAMAMGSLVIGLATPVDQIFAARVGEGSVAALGYANRIIALATGVGAMAIGRALLPVLSAAAVAGQIALGRAHALRWAWMTLAGGAFVSAIGWAVAPWAVSLLFERGSFTATDTRIVADILRALLPQLPFFFAGIVLVQWFAALGRFGQLFYVSFAVISVKILLNMTLAPLFGTVGIAASTSGMYAVSFVLLLVIARRRA